MTAVNQRRALVTGGSGDIGSAVCHALAEQGLALLVHANTRLERAEAVAEAIRANGGQAQAVSFDVCDDEATAACLEEQLAAGPIQVVVNNAGSHHDAPMAGMSAADWRRIVDINLHGFFNVTQPLLLPMARTRWGRIVNMSSVAAVAGNRGQTNYAAAKAGLNGATRALALEMASRSITVNSVAPGIIAGNMTDAVFDETTIQRLVPLGRAGSTEEVASLVAFLASERAAYITGQVINVNGGMV